MKRINISSGAKWENLVGYSRVVRVGQMVEVAGTTSVVAGRLIGQGNPYLQTKVILESIGQALAEAGASLEDVVRTRMYVTDIGLWEEVGKAHFEFFKDIKPVTSMVEVVGLIHPDMMVEIEATAIVP
ncbi:MAG: RidA family protein [Saprospiraceae bacterium]|nr:MAG: RidA family protein [Saprospiraceae bacterium]